MHDGIACIATGHAQVVRCKCLYLIWSALRHTVSKIRRIS